FVETAFDAETSVVTARRRPRSSEESPVWVAATLSGDGEVELETDRCVFLGRGRSLARPAALASKSPLSGTTGSVLDPVFALRRSVELAPGREANFVFSLSAGNSEDVVVSAVRTLRERTGEAGTKDVVRAAASAERARRKRFLLSNEQAELAQELAGAM